jgi:diguanylate cyclase (GGDEF)-like protein
MDDFNGVWFASALWALLGVAGVGVSKRYPQHPYLLWFAAAWLCAGVASTAAWLLAGPGGWVHGAVAVFAWLAVLLTAQGMGMRFGRHMHLPMVAVISLLMLVGWGYFAYLEPAALPQQRVLGLGLALLLAHVGLVIGRAHMRHAMERNAVLVYAAMCVAIAVRPWLPEGSTPYGAAWWLPLCAGVFSAAVVACVRAESPPPVCNAQDRDGLTGVLSRHAFEQACGARPAQQHIRFMVLCDLDHFERVNQQFGVAVGDDMLRSFAHLLQTSVRTGDVVGRLGGEEFGVALRHIDPDHAAALVQRIVDAMAQQHWARKLALGPLTASFGMATVREEDSLDIALHRADVLLCQAKDGGGNRMVTQAMGLQPEMLFQ